jgi:glycosyltransferase involved in cell wall biosynthesis
VREPAVWGGGAEARTIELAAALNAQGVRADLLTSEDAGLAARARARGIATFVLPHEMLVRRRDLLAYYVTGKRALQRLLRERAISIVHTVDSRSILPAIRAGAPLGVPVVSHVVDMDGQWVKPRRVRALNRTYAVVAVNRAVRDSLVAGGIAPERIRVIHRGFDPAPFAAARATRAATRRALGAGEGEIVAGVFARLHERKRQEDAIRAIAEPSLRDLPLRLLLVGADQDPERRNERRLLALVEELGVGDRVRLLGHRDDVPALMAACDLTIAPFVNEAFGGVLAESMHAGTPVAGYRSGGIPEIVRDGVEGLLVEATDVSALAAAVERMARDPALRARLAAGALERASAFTLDRQLSAVRALHEEAIAAARSARA